ncbi:MAG: T3SS effector HopA1 family protein [Myxococcaceae bacterium]
MTRLARFVGPARRVAPEALAEWLYQRYFIGWSGGPGPDDLAGDPLFVAELARACEGAVCVEGGFVAVPGRQRGGRFVARDGVTVLAPSARKWRDGTLAIALPCARPSALPGFFSVVSRAGRLGARERHLKFYVNATPAGAVGLLGRALSDPSMRRARFEAKCANDPRSFGRRDTVLFYVAFDSVAVVRRWLARQPPRWFRAESPPLTKRLFRGVSVAQSPLTSESYGAHRTRLIAEGLRTSFLERRGWAECVAERFEREGLEWGLSGSA